MVLSRSDGVEYARLTTDDLGRATLSRTLSGNVPVSALSTHVYRVMDSNWKEPGPFAGHPATIAGLGCPHDCKVPQVGGCTVDHIHVHVVTGIAPDSDFDVEWANNALDFMAVMEGVASVIEPNPASGAAGATLGTTELAKGLVEEVDKRRQKLTQATAIEIKLVLQRSYCVQEVCYLWPKTQQFWKKEYFDEVVDPPASLTASEASGKWVGNGFDLRNADVRQELVKAYEKALKKCEGQ